MTGEVVNAPVLTHVELRESMLTLASRRRILAEEQDRLNARRAELAELEARVLASCMQTGQEVEMYGLRVRLVKGRASTTYHESELRETLTVHHAHLLPAVFQRVETWKFNRKAAEALEDQIGGLDPYRTVKPGENRMVLEEVPA